MLLTENKYPTVEDDVLHHANNHSLVSIPVFIVNEIHAIKLSLNCFIPLGRGISSILACHVSRTFDMTVQVESPSNVAMFDI